MVQMMEPQVLLGKSYSQLFRDGLIEGTKPAERIEGFLYVEAPAEGYSLAFDGEDTVDAVHLYREGHRGYAGYRGILPLGLTFGMSQKDVRSILGNPTDARDEQTIRVLGAVPAWDRYRVEFGWVHVEYEMNRSGIRLVTIFGSGGAGAQGAA
ncbi:hypothetical protein GCM10007167_03490 [Vulcaniibacterium thermophilum]|uniref:Uncharacterized protein n=1 Tax=Vulcaniibacterium thermophilum TaxID=1169913 RepID=A0A918YWA1_9GAMM|nr:hypothetical protein GCM10007167_03490 [Vulcaniibacterium thermophilum]